MEGERPCRIWVVDNGLNLDRFPEFHGSGNVSKYNGDLATKWMQRDTGNSVVLSSVRLSETRMPSQNDERESKFKKSSTHPRSFGSAYDPVLTGVAYGWNELFPLVPLPSAAGKKYQEDALHSHHASDVSPLLTTDELLLP